ncbi:MAG: YCF48-related protein, partial [Bacteroidota bacterium]
MNKRLLFFGCFISIIFSLSAQDWTQQNPNVELRRLYDISIHSSGNAWAVGFDGSILHSADFGQNWQAQAPAGPSDLLFVAAPEDGNAQQVMAIGDSTINYTNDGGANWTETNSGFQTGEFNGLAVPSTDAAYIITWDGEMLKSTDFGMSWDSLALPVNDEWRSISFINDSTGWIASALGFLLHTTDGGMNWTSLPTTQFSWQLFATFYDENIG